MPWLRLKRASTSASATEAPWPRSRRRSSISAPVGEEQRAAVWLYASATMPVHLAEAVGETARRPSLPPGSAQDRPAVSREYDPVEDGEQGSASERRGSLMAKREVIDLQRDADEARSGVAKSEAARRHLERFKQGEIDRWGATPASLPRWATSMSSVHRSHGRRFASPRNRWQLPCSWAWPSASGRGPRDPGLDGPLTRDNDPSTSSPPPGGSENAGDRDRPSSRQHRLRQP